MHKLAQDHYNYESSNKGPELKIGNDYDFIKHVKRKIIEEHYSPDAVIMELENTDFINPGTGKPLKTKICTKTLYNYIDKEYFLT